jgi:hypothetical protein
MFDAGAAHRLRRVRCPEVQLGLILIWKLQVREVELRTHCTKVVAHEFVHTANWAFWLKDCVTASPGLGKVSEHAVEDPA